MKALVRVVVLVVVQQLTSSLVEAQNYRNVTLKDCQCVCVDDHENAYQRRAPDREVSYDTIEQTSQSTVISHTPIPQKDVPLDRTCSATSSIAPKFISRSDWGAANFRKPPKDAWTSAATHVIVSQTGTPSCRTKDHCSFLLRMFQDQPSLQTTLYDVNYNFLVGGDGLVYLGRGWGKLNPYDDDNDVKSIEISLIGRFEHINPTKEQLMAIKRLICLGVREGKVEDDYQLMDYKQDGKPNAMSLGNKVLNMIKKLG